MKLGLEDLTKLTVRDNLLNKEFDGSLKRNVALAPLTTLGIGGPASYLAEVDSPEKLIAAVQWCKERGINLLVIGGGSNLLVSDSGYNGLVLKIALRGLDVARKSDEVTLRAAAGEEWDRVVELAVENGLCGIECISGVPGLVGATPIQNVGAYGQEVGESIVEVQAVDMHNAEHVVFKASECEFGYRTSRFKTIDARRYIVTSVKYRLIPGGEPAIRYPELERALKRENLAQPKLTDVRRTVIAIRRRKGMVIDPADPDSRSAGSFFVNPTVTQNELEAIKFQAGTRGVPISDIPIFPASGGGLKVPAAWLIERAGFACGYGRGAAGLSTKHPLAIVNRGGATALEVIQLADEITNRVKDIFGVQLTPEPVFVGFGQDRRRERKGDQTIF